MGSTVTRLTREELAALDSFPPSVSSSSCALECSRMAGRRRKQVEGEFTIMTDIGGCLSACHHGNNI